MRKDIKILVFNSIALLFSFLSIFAFVALKQITIDDYENTGLYMVRVFLTRQHGNAGLFELVAMGCAALLFVILCIALFIEAKKQINKGVAIVLLFFVVALASGAIAMSFLGKDQYVKALEFEKGNFVEGAVVAWASAFLTIPFFAIAQLSQGGKAEEKEESKLEERIVNLENEVLGLKDSIEASKNLIQDDINRMYETLRDEMSKTLQLRDGEDGESSSISDLKEEYDNKFNDLYTEIQKMYQHQSNSYIDEMNKIKNEIEEIKNQLGDRNSNQPAEYAPVLANDYYGRDPYYEESEVQRLRRELEELRYGSQSKSKSKSKNSEMDKLRQEIEELKRSQTKETKSQSNNYDQQLQDLLDQLQKSQQSQMDEYEAQHKKTKADLRDAIEEEKRKREELLKKLNKQNQ